MTETAKSSKLFGQTMKYNVSSISRFKYSF